jgi:hypothetical protein
LPAGLWSLLVDTRQDWADKRERAIVNYSKINQASENYYRAHAKADHSRCEDVEFKYIYCRS